MLFDPSDGDAVPTSASLSAEFAKRHFGDLPNIQVDVVTIDAFCARENLTRVSLVKIDVEGYEDHALRGMQGILRRDKPVVLMEVLPDFESRLRAVFDELFGDFYDWVPIHEGGREVDRNVWLTPRAQSLDA